MLNKRRNEFHILSDIMTLSQEGVNKTQILYKCNLSYHLLKKYLDFLVNNRFIDKKQNGSKRKVYILTKKGYSFLSDINNILVWFN